MVFHPLPGTRAWKQAGEPPAASLAPSFAEVSYVPQGWTPGSLKRMQRKAFVRFYCRPRAAAALVADVRSPSHLLWILRRMIRWMAPAWRRR